MIKGIDYIITKLAIRRYGEANIKLFRYLLYAVLLWESLTLISISSEIYGPDSALISIPPWGNPFVYLVQIVQTNVIDNLYILFHFLQIIFLILLLVGKNSVLIRVLLFFVTINLYRSMADLTTGGHHLALQLLFFNVFIFSPHSIDIKKAKGQLMNISSNVFFFLARIQVCLLYIVAGISKLFGEHWVEGDALYYVLNNSSFNPGWLSEFWMKQEWLVRGSTWVVLSYQLAFPVLVWFKTLTNKLIVIGIFVHLGILIFVGITDFSLIMMASHGLFWVVSKQVKAPE